MKSEAEAEAIEIEIDNNNKKAKRNRNRIQNQERERERDGETGNVAGRWRLWDFPQFSISIFIVWPGWSTASTAKGFGIGIGIGLGFARRCRHSVGARSPNTMCYLDINRRQLNAWWGMFYGHENKKGEGSNGGRGSGSDSDGDGDSAAAATANGNNLTINYMKYLTKRAKCKKP